MAQTDAATATAGPRPVFSGRYRGVVLTLLVLAYTLNFIDRTIIATIGQAIKVDLHLTDTQLGLLGGFSFAILYTFLGIPIARLAERWNRVSIISIAMVVWSGFTAACGLAGNFAQLLALRVGVGFGEAGLSPPAHSLISDYFPPGKRASALSIYAFGIPLGGMLGAALGGWLAKTYGWRVALMAVGAPGVLMALMIKLIIREPLRGASDPAQRSATAEAAAATAARAPRTSVVTRELSELGAVIGNLFGNWPVLNMVLGITIGSFAGYGTGQFAQPYFIRTFGLDYAVVGLVFGLIGGFSAGLGTLAGGFITDWASKHGARWYSLTPAIGMAVATPIYALAYVQPDWRTAALILALPGIFAYTYLGPTFAVVQNVVETRRRATATAVLLFFLNFIALGGGPLFTGWLIDRFAQFDFTHPAAHSLWNSLAGVRGGDVHGLAPRFAGQCPGGAAVAGSAPSLAVKCKVALVAATRDGLLVTIGFYAWAAFHYFLGAFGLAERLAKVAAERKAREA